MMAHPGGVPPRHVALVVGAVVLGALASFGGIFWVLTFPDACACPGQSPLGAYYELGRVSQDPYSGAYQATVEATPATPEPSGEIWPPPPTLSTLAFQVVAPNRTALELSVVCAVAANGTVLGVWAGATGGWASHASSPPPTCGAKSAPNGSLPPGSSTLASGTVLFYYLNHTAPTGTTFTVAVIVQPEGAVWAGAISQTFAAGGVVWARSTRA